MTTMFYTQQRDCVNSLGVPVDNLSLQDAVERIVSMARVRDGQSRLVSSLNVATLFKTLGYPFSRPRQPEVLNVLRTSELVTANGLSIVWLSRIMGRPLQQQIAGTDLAPALAQRAAKEGLSLFLFGGTKGISCAARALKMVSPMLNIVGTCASPISNDAVTVSELATIDARVLDDINNSGADILLLGLDNPMQELWLNRNRHKLKVPVVVELCNVFDILGSRASRVPLRKEQLKSVRLFPTEQEPQINWREQITALLKLGVIAAPLVYYRAKQALFYGEALNAEPPYLRWNSVWSSRDQSLALLRLPALVTSAYLEQMIMSLLQEHAGTAVRLLDFSAVKHIHFSGQQELFRLGQLLQDTRNDVSILGMSNGLKRQLAACGIMDILGEEGNGDALSTLSYSPQGLRVQGIGCKSYVMTQTTLIFLSGRVNSDGLSGLGLIECLQHATRNRTCVIDLRNVTLLESTAIAEFNQLIAEQRDSRRGVVLISGADANARQMFHMSGHPEPVIFIDDQTFLSSIVAEGQHYE